MNLRLRPELERFVDEQVKAGNYAPPEEVLEAGVARLMLDPAGDQLDADDLRQIRTSLEQMRRGEAMDWQPHSDAFRKRYTGT
jgi:Arc/MetJ-type ribon-helix-helix transcriptional regulator